MEIQGSRKYHQLVDFPSLVNTYSIRLTFFCNMVYGKICVELDESAKGSVR